MKAELSGASMLFVIAGSAMAAFTGETPFLSGGTWVATQPSSERVGFVVAIPIGTSANQINSNETFANTGGTNVTLSSPISFPAFPPGTAITGIGWDVHLTADAPSWQSHMGIRFSATSAGPGFDLFPGGGSNVSGGPTQFVSPGILRLANYNIPDLILPTGNLSLYFYELVDDLSGVRDGYWGSTIYLEYIPAPAAVGLLGLAGLRCVARKRRPI